ncbi:hypothetical protein SLEP1_g948 [Rubroshorea leprosula]|uniref:Ankyrin repeat protein n=1 Tax=Rubroshorea leprosula TaxID=152421 RepID=A0AAV5HKI7_9ROSI|nr:hypothetical protein SLEP1_g948 [Rubroshorea leprosula]
MEIEEFSARFTSLLESSRTSVDDLFKAASTGDLAPFQHLVEAFKSEELFLKMALNVGDENCKSFLHVAAARGRKKLCKFLLEEGKLDINVKDCEAGETPLLHATKEGHFPTAAFLLENGADPNSRSWKRRTSLHYAAEHGSKELIQLLISKGAEINAVADCGTPLQYAAGKGKEEFVKLLLDHHADPNVISHDLFSPLLASIRAQSLECMKLLLKAGANPNFHGSKGMTPLGYAASEGLKEFIKCLLNAGADPNIANNLGMTPIEEAALANKRRVVRILFPWTSPIPTIHGAEVERVISDFKVKGS